MGKLDAYLRSIERFGATGAVLTSGQPVTLRFPSGDRNATQIVPHDQLVVLVREIAPPASVDQIDQQRPARFEIESGGFRYLVQVTPRPGAWQVAVEGQGPAGGPGAAPAGLDGPTLQTPPARPTPVPGGGGGGGGGETGLMLERGQYDPGPSAATTAPAASGSGLLDQLTRAARAARATDLYLAAGAAPLQRVAGELVPAGGSALDGDVLSREIGVVAPPEARAQWFEQGTGVFAYGDAGGRVRVTLGRDRSGPSAALRLLPDEPPPLDRLNVSGIEDWLGRTGLVLIAGTSGAGKTVTLAAIVRALGERRRRVVTLEAPIELVHAAPSICQRALGEHVATIGAGVAAAMGEGADAIVISQVASAADAHAVVEAVAGGHLVVATILAPAAGIALDRLLALLPADQRDGARALLGEALLGTVRPVPARGGGRTFEIAARRA